MHKLFVVSDVHSFYKPLMEALNEAGFDKNNPDHWLISCGDCFDRGPDSVELLHYLMSLERKILVKGNHDLLLDTCCSRKYPMAHDVSNGTTTTIEDIGGAASDISFQECCTNTLNKLAAYRDLLINYFETKNFIFVHSWIPMSIDCDWKSSKPWYQLDKAYSYEENWRNASESDWEEAMWTRPFLRAKEGLNKTGKTIVFGHWHCSTGYSVGSDGELPEFGPDACWEPYKNEEQGIIGIDRCTAHTGKVNVVVLEDDFLEDTE